VVLSYSGNTTELTSLLKYANRFGIKVIGCASKVNSMLLKASDIKVLLPKVREADPTGLVPTTSTTISLLYFDTLCIALQNKMKFSKDKFKIYHSGGSIGQTLLLVKDIMIKGNKLPLVQSNNTINVAIKEMNKKKLGILIVINKKKSGIGIVSDGDIRRAVKTLKEFDKIEKIMTKNPIFISENMPALKSLALMNEKKITSLCVSSELDFNKKIRRVKGIVHIHNLLNFGIK